MNQDKTIKDSAHCNKDGHASMCMVSQSIKINIVIVFTLKGLPKYCNIYLVATYFYDVAQDIEGVVH